jgi:F0F1-type ATP synthase assembly protein I
MTDRPDRDERLRFVTAGMEFFFAVGLPTVGGLLLDRHFRSLPLWTLVGLGLGFAAGLYRLCREVRNISGREQSRDRTNNTDRS